MAMRLGSIAASVCASVLAGLAAHPAAAKPVATPCFDDQAAIAGTLRQVVTRRPSTRETILSHHLALAAPVCINAHQAGAIVRLDDISDIQIVFEDTRAAKAADAQLGLARTVTGRFELPANDSFPGQVVLVRARFQAEPDADADVERPEFDFASLQSKAASGDEAAIEELVSAYENGSGVAEDEAQAKAWRRRLFETRLARAEAGAVAAMDEVAQAYANGTGVDIDDARSKHWYQRAFTAWLKLAQSGDVKAMLRIANLYDIGYGVAEDKAAAALWLQRAADKGSFEAMTGLGEKYLSGEGVARNPETARERFTRASADPDDAYSALSSLARMYRDGDGIGKDEAQVARLHVRMAEQYGGWKRRMTGSGFADDIAKADPVYRRAIQEELAARGLYRGPIDGQMRRSIRKAAVQLWQRNAKVEPLE